MTGRRVEVPTASTAALTSRTPSCKGPEAATILWKSEAYTGQRAANAFVLLSVRLRLHAARGKQHNLNPGPSSTGS